MGITTASDDLANTTPGPGPVLSPGATPAQLAQAGDPTEAFARIEALPVSRRAMAYTGLAGRPDLTSGDVSRLIGIHNALYAAGRGIDTSPVTYLALTRALCARPDVSDDDARTLYTTWATTCTIPTWWPDFDRPERFAGPMIDRILDGQTDPSQLLPKVAQALAALPAESLTLALDAHLTAALAQATDASSQTSRAWAPLSWPVLPLDVAKRYVSTLFSLAKVTPGQVKTLATPEHGTALLAARYLLARPDLDAEACDLIRDWFHDTLDLAAELTADLARDHDRTDPHPDPAMVFWVKAVLHRVASDLDNLFTAPAQTSAGRAAMNNLFAALTTRPAHHDVLTLVAAYLPSSFANQLDRNMVPDAIEAGAPLAFARPAHRGTSTLIDVAPTAGVVDRLLSGTPTWLHENTTTLTRMLANHLDLALTEPWQRLYTWLAHQANQAQDRLDDLTDLLPATPDGHIHAFDRDFAADVAARAQYISYSDKSSPLAVDTYLAWAAGHADPHVRAAVLSVPGLVWNPDHLDAARTDPHPLVRATLAHRTATTPGAEADLAPTPAHLDALMADPDPHVRATVAARADATPAHLAAAVTDPDPKVRYVAVTHPELDPTHLGTLGKDAHPGIAAHATERFVELITP